MRFAALILRAPFGRLPSGAPVALYTLTNRRGMQARIATYGATLVSLSAPDRHGRFADVVLGLDTLEGYLRQSAYLGAVIGRYANRIAGGRFTLDGRSYALQCNDGPNALHGGKVGFDRVLWEVLRACESPAGPELTLQYLSRDGEEGFPGNLEVRLTYSLTDDNSLILAFEGTTDKPTVMNLTAHSYFNLGGHGNILGHVLQSDAQRFIAVGPTLLPVAIHSVAATPFDFRTPTALGARIGTDTEQLRLAHGGYDHNLILERTAPGLTVAASVCEPDSGRVLEVLSDQPGLQLYTGNLLDGSITGRGARKYTRHSALCLEPQHFPDSPNHADFPSTELRPGQVYHSTIVYRFGIR